LVDALYEEGVCRALLEAVGRRRKLKGSSGEILAVPTAAFRALGGAAGAELAPRILGVQQSNTSIAVGERFVLKLFRRVPEGVSPDLEMGRFLTDGARFAHTPAVAGYLEHREGRGDPRTIGILHAFVRNEGDAWTYTLDEVQRFLERALSRPRPAETPEPPQGLLALAAAEPPEVVRELMGTYLESARQLGRRTAELHAALASADDPAFAPEPFTPFYQRSLYQSLRNLCASAFQLLRERLAALPADAAGEARELLPLEPRVLQAFRPVLDRRIDAVRMRFHGDYHLGQILYTGRDFVIIDFEGEPGRSLGERRIKRSPLVDVAGMLRSFHYAASTALSGERAAAVLRPEDVPTLEPWARLWHRGASGTFLRAYLEGVRGASFLPRSPETIELLLGASVLEKSLYELRYELNNRPGWAWVPARGVRELVEAMAGGR
jgi:maltose alpha-D-glucosyltransferase/alpha-amylase